MDVYVLAPTREQAWVWCSENNIDVGPHPTYLIGTAHDVRGRHIAQDDRVIIFGSAHLRKDFPAIRASLTIAGATLENTEYVT